MALFSSKPQSKSKAAKPARNAAAKNAMGRLSGVLKAPWLSEKALIATASGVYVFEVPRDATKPDVAAAIELVYKVTPRAVRMVNLPAKKVSLRTRRGVGARARRHKAYVYLKKGDTIQF